MISLLLSRLHFKMYFLEYLRKRGLSIYQSEQHYQMYDRTNLCHNFVLRGTHPPKLIVEPSKNNFKFEELLVHEPYRN